MDEDGLAVGMRVEVRGKGEFRIGTVTGKRDIGKWEVQVDGWGPYYALLKP